LYSKNTDGQHFGRATTTQLKRSKRRVCDDDGKMMMWSFRDKMIVGGHARVSSTNKIFQNFVPTSARMQFGLSQRKLQIAQLLRLRHSSPVTFIFVVGFFEIQVVKDTEHWMSIFCC
jgi:5-keto 4-deoxyuronate isomerase